MPAAQDKASKPRAHWTVRLVVLVLVAFTINELLAQVSRYSQSAAAPAGFKRGVVHGALMPLALPSLLLGKDVMIYDPVNNGRLYKLGYTVGVNGCGALFFGVLFWRFSRWNKQRVAALPLPPQ